jgi:ribosomal subunit interface protein
VDIVVRGRHAEVSERFREHVSHKLSKVERYDGKCHRIDVEISQESNPRRADDAVRVEITCHGRGPVVRGEAAASEKYAALDIAYARLEERLRRAADRRTDRMRKAKPPTGQVGGVAAAEPGLLVVEAPIDADETEDDAPVGGLAVDGDGPLVVREKTHVAGPMTLDQALYEMELLGHDFFLFSDAATGLASVVYRRKGYDYGVLHLSVDPGAGSGPDRATAHS